MEVKIIAIYSLNVVTDESNSPLAGFSPNDKIEGGETDVTIFCFVKYFLQELSEFSKLSFKYCDTNKIIYVLCEHDEDWEIIKERKLKYVDFFQRKKLVDLKDPIEDMKKFCERDRRFICELKQNKMFFKCLSNEKISNRILDIESEIKKDTVESTEWYKGIRDLRQAKKAEGSRIL